MQESKNSGPPGGPRIDVQADVQTLVQTNVQESKKFQLTVKHLDGTAQQLQMPHLNIGLDELFELIFGKQKEGEYKCRGRLLLKLKNGVTHQLDGSHNLQKMGAQSGDILYALNVLRGS